MKSLFRWTSRATWGVIFIVIVIVTSLLLVDVVPPQPYVRQLDGGTPLELLKDRHPGGSWLLRRCFRGLFEYNDSHQVVSDLATGWSATLSVHLKPPKGASLPNGMAITANNVDSFLFISKAGARDPRLAGLAKLQNVAPGHVAISFNRSGPEIVDALTEILGLKAMESSEVAQTLTVTLSKDLRWDGTHPLTSRDVLFTHQKFKELGAQTVYARMLQDIDAVTAPDDRTITIVSRRVSHAALEFWTAPVLPEFYYLVHPLTEWPALAGGGNVVLHQPLMDYLKQPPASSERVRVTLPVQDKLIVGFNLTVPHLQSDGVRRNLALAAQGKPVRAMKPFDLEILCPDDDGEAIHHGEELVKAWKPAGVRARLAKLDRKRYQDRLASRNFQAFLGTLYNGEGFGPALYFDPAQWPSGENYFAYTPSETGRLIHRLRATFNPSARQALFHQIEERVRLDVPCIVLRTDESVPLSVPRVLSEK